MPGYTLHGHKQRVESTFERAVLVDDLQTQADLARYLCVLVSGFLEQAVRHIYGEYAQRNAGPNVVRYVERRLGGLQNINARKLVGVVADFDATWSNELETFLGDERRDHVDSLVANRNQISHGEDVGLTYSRVRAFFTSVCEVVDFMKAQCA